MVTSRAAQENRIGHVGVIEAIKAFDALYIEHSRFAAVLNEIREVIQLGGSGTEAICLHVSGPPGSGKSTLRAKLSKEFPRIQDGRTLKEKGCVVVADYVPLLQLEMPATPTTKALCYAILEAFGERIPQKGDEPALSWRVGRYVAACGTTAALIDEAQRLVDRNGIVAAERLLDWVKWFHAKYGISVILFGLRRLQYLFEQDIQLSRRWNAELRLAPYWWKVSENRDDYEAQAMFIGILSAFRDNSPVPFSVDIEDEVTAFRFFYASQGIFGGVKKLLREAIRVAFRLPERDRHISHEVLAEAFERSFGNHPQKLENPFGAAFSLKMPPRPIDDGELLPAPAERRKRKARRSDRRREIEGNLTLG